MKTIVSPSTTKNTVSVSTTTKTVTVSGTGTVGPQGGAGSSTLTGSGVPAATLGAVNDLYLDQTGFHLYKKTSSSTWVDQGAYGGAQGPTGLTGATGPAGTIAVGSVTTGDAGSSVLITNTGSTTEATLNFTIPKGATGATGPQGTQGNTGAAGADGADGTDGTDGADGKTVLNGSGSPSSSLGSDGDFYIDTSADSIYGPKTTSGGVGNWGSATSLVGPAGESYTHPDHSGEVTSTGHGATVIVDNIVDEANLKVSNSPTDGYFLSAQSGNTGGLTWAVPTDTNTTYTSSDFTHDDLSGFVADEHIDWTASGAGTIHATNYTNTTYTVGDGGLTQKNFTTTLKDKLDGITAGAEENVNADWDSSTGDSQILNKPTLVSLSQVAALAVALG